jgi:hypothetical protein
VPWNEVMHKWGEGDLHSGSKKGPKVTSQKQAEAIMYSEKKESKKKPEYRPNKDPLKRAFKDVGGATGDKHEGY